MFIRPIEKSPFYPYSTITPAQLEPHPEKPRGADGIPFLAQDWRVYHGLTEFGENTLHECNLLTSGAVRGREENIKIINDGRYTPSGAHDAAMTRVNNFFTAGPKETRGALWHREQIETVANELLRGWEKMHPGKPVVEEGVEWRAFVRGLADSPEVRFIKISSLSHQGRIDNAGLMAIVSAGPALSGLTVEYVEIIKDYCKAIHNKAEYQNMRINAEVLSNYAMTLIRCANMMLDPLRPADTLRSSILANLATPAAKRLCETLTKAEESINTFKGVFVPPPEEKEKAKE